MIYTVIGYPSGIMDTMTLHTRLLSHRLADLVPKIGILTIGSDDIETLESRFGTGFANFILLDDAAIAACKAVDSSIAPSGTVLGLIDEAELRSPLPVLPVRRQ